MHLKTQDWWLFNSHFEIFMKRRVDLLWNIFFSKNNKGCKEYKISVSMKAILIGITIAPRAVVLQAALALVCAENLGCKW
jgi:hypothetical protein